jgi:hypothetical protein
MLGFGNTGGSSVDLLNRSRPSGGGSTLYTATDSGTATAGAASTLTDSGKSWTTNAYAGHTVEITGGTGSGQLRRITSNTGTVLTVSVNWTTNPDNTSAYSVYPSGKLAAVGAYERHNVWTQETTTVRTGGSALVCVGPGAHDFDVAVDATSTTVSVYLRYDSTHGTTNKPQFLLVNGDECGVSDATATMTSAADTWEQLSHTFTPARTGIVTVRLVSRSAAGNGKAFADDFSVT